MKFSLANILLATALLVVLLCWHLERAHYKNLTSAMLDARRFDERRKFRGISFPKAGYSDFEMNLLNANGVMFMECEDVLELLAVFNCYNDKSKPDVVYAHGFSVLYTLNCADLLEL